MRWWHSEVQTKCQWPFGGAAHVNRSHAQTMPIWKRDCNIHEIRTIFGGSSTSRSTRQILSELADLSKYCIEDLLVACGTATQYEQIYAQQIVWNVNFLFARHWRHTERQALAQTMRRYYIRVTKTGLSRSAHRVVKMRRIIATTRRSPREPRQTVGGGDA